MLHKFKDISRLIALPHSIFALPFSIVGFIFAQQKGALIPISNISIQIILIIAAVVLARTAAMSFNRLVDAKIDSKNPRTEQREIPQGKISKMQASLLCLISVSLFFYVSFLLGWHCLVLSPLVILFLFFYSLTKRFTQMAHLFLGLALALAPGGAWWVLRPQVEMLPVLLMLAVFFWVAGFDVLYSCQDILFDREHNIFSIPASTGVHRAFYFSRFFHATCFVFFLLVGISAGLGTVYFLGMLFIGLFLLSQHLIISPFNLKRIDHAFFTLNGMISIVYLGIVIICYL